MMRQSLNGCEVLPPVDPVPRPNRGERKGKRFGQSAGRFQLLNAFVDFTMKGLSRNEIAVWLALFRDSKQGIARTSQADIARRMGMSDRTVRRAIRQLEKQDLLFVVYRGRLGCGPSSYRVRAAPRGDP